MKWREGGEWVGLWAREWSSDPAVGLETQPLFLGRTGSMQLLRFVPAISLAQI